jgi:hypothetical protein
MSKKAHAKLDALRITLNRLQAQKARLQTGILSASKRERRARTRTLIQLGGLLQLLGLPALCGIREGEDLQLDNKAMDKAAILLGMLITLHEGLPEALDEERKKNFQGKGKRLIKSHQAT